MFQSILLDSTSGTLKEWFQNLWNDTGFVVDYSRFEGYSLGIWGCLIMLVVACFLVYLAVVKKFEPMLLVGIAFGAFLINIPGAYDALMAGPANGQPGGLFWYLYKGVEWVIFPPLIFLGIGAMTDFGPLIANPKSLLLGAAAQVGIFLALLIALLIGFTPQEAGAIGIIGAAGVSAVPMAARVVQDVGRQYDPENYLLMHAMGPNVAGVIGSAIAAGVLLAIL